MTSSGGGGGGGGGARVSIPENLRKTIQNIKEITGKQHSDEDVYTMLKDCSMDPNETAQKLFYLDTFHEVKSKRDRRKESSNVKVPEPKSEARGRGARGGRGASSNYVSGGGRIMAAQRDNRANNFSERGSMAALSQYKTKNNSAPHSKTKALNTEPNGPSHLSNGVSTNEEAPNAIMDTATNVSGDKLPVELEKPGSKLAVPEDDAVWPITSLSESLVRTELAKVSPEPHHLLSIVDSASASSSSDLGPTMLLNGQSATSETHETAAQDANSMHSKESLQKEDQAENSQLPQSASPSSSSVDSGSLTMKASSTRNDVSVQEASDLSGAVVHVSDTVVASKVASITIEESHQPVSSSSVPDGQHVTFPNHFRVPEAFKNGLIFGSFNADFEEKTESTNGCLGKDKSSTVSDTSQGCDEVTKESLPSEHIGDISNNIQASNLSSVSSPLEMSKQDVPLPPPDPSNPVVQDIQTNHFGIISPIMGSQLVQLEVPEPQVPDVPRSSKVNGNVPSLSSASPSPSPSSTPTPTVQTSVAVPLQPVPVFRQPYPLNYFPYGHYLPPFYLPTVHHLLSHNAFAQQPTSGSLYLSPAVAPPGVKIPFPAFKPAANTTPIGIPSAYGSYASIGYTAAPSVSSGTSSGNEDLAASQLKENQIYSNPQLQSEGSALWIPPIGQDLSSLQVNSLYNLPQGQHVPFSPAPGAHGAFGINQPSQSMGTVPTVHSLLQQSQAGAVETVGLPSGAYQNPQHPQINWNTNF